VTNNIICNAICFNYLTVTGFTRSSNCTLYVGISSEFKKQNRTMVITIRSCNMLYNTRKYNYN